MEILQRLQPLDIVFAILWAAIVGWGLQTGFVRQMGMLIGVYGAFLAAGSLYRQAGQAMAMALGPDNELQLEFVGYVVVFVVIFGVIAFVLWRAYPASRLNRRFGADNAFGAALAAIWGVLMLIALLTILRYYATVPWHGQEATQQSVRTEVGLSQVAPVLQIVVSPLWQAMAPWFPAPVAPQL